MSTGLVAFHYPKPEFRDEMIQRVHAAARALAEVPGCLGVHCWETVETGAIVRSGTWESDRLDRPDPRPQRRRVSTSPTTIDSYDHGMCSTCRRSRPLITIWSKRSLPGDP